MSSSKVGKYARLAFLFDGVLCCVNLPAAGVVKGDVRVSGHQKVQQTFARIMGYVEQFDVHSPNVRTFPCASGP